MGDRILVVDDDALTTDGVAFALRDEGFHVDVAHDGRSGLERALGGGADLVVLDVRLPGGLSGLDVCAELRRRSAIPILMLTARHGEVDKVLALERGADDYVTKPFSLAELIARVRALLRGRALARNGMAAVVHEVGALRVDPLRREVTLAGEAVHATPSEFLVLELLARRSGEAVTRGELCEHLWGSDRSLDTRACDLHVARLRRKLEPDPGAPRLLVTVRGVGYKLSA